MTTSEWVTNRPAAVSGQFSPRRERDVFFQGGRVEVTPLKHANGELQGTCCAWGIEHHPPSRMYFRKQIEQGTGREISRTGILAAACASQRAAAQTPQIQSVRIAEGKRKRARASLEWETPLHFSRLSRCWAQRHRPRQGNINLGVSPRRTWTGVGQGRKCCGSHGPRALSRTAAAGRRSPAQGPDPRRQGGFFFFFFFLAG